MTSNFSKLEDLIPLKFRCTGFPGVGSTLSDFFGLLRMCLYYPNPHKSYYPLEIKIGCSVNMFYKISKANVLMVQV